jgi:hypothetical protein
MSGKGLHESMPVVQHFQHMARRLLSLIIGSNKLSPLQKLKEKEARSMKYIYSALMDAASNVISADPHCVNFTPRQRRSLRWLSLYSRGPSDKKFTN